MLRLRRLWRKRNNAMNRVRHLAGISALLLAACALDAQTIPGNVGASAATMPTALQNVGFEPPLNGQMPLDLPFRDETGRSVQLRDYFGQQKPVVLAFVYYGCPMLCDQVEQGVVGVLRMLSFNPGRDYKVVFVIFFFFFSSRRRHTRLQGDWSSDVCSSNLPVGTPSRERLRQARDR